MRSDNSRHIIASAQNRAIETRARALRALRRLDSGGKAITFETVAREANVSRSWLYAQPDLRAEIQQRRTRETPTTRTTLTPHRQRASDASLLRRLDAANEQLHRLENQHRELRDALAEALGCARAARVLRQRPSDTPGRQSFEIVESP